MSEPKPASGRRAKSTLAQAIADKQHNAEICEKLIDKIERITKDAQAHAFSAGERKGRIAGLREAAELARHSSYQGPIADQFEEMADQSERAEQATGKEEK